MNSLEIARLAGVSKTTVSRVLNNSPNVNIDTRNKVLQVIKEHNFIPNNSAQVLKGIRTKTIGLFLFNFSNNDYIFNKIGQNDYYMEFVNAAISVACDHDHYILVYTIKKKSEISIIQSMFAQKRIDSAIVVGDFGDHPKVFECLVDGYAIAFFDQSYHTVRQYCTENSSVFLLNHDDYALTRHALDYLYAQGHRKIGSLQGDCSTNSGAVRKQAFDDFIKEKKLQPYNLMNINCKFVYEIALERVGLWLDQHPQQLPTAIFSFNDGMAIGAMEAMRNRNIEVPGQVSIIGFDDIFACMLTTPKLTTIRVPVVKMMEQAVALLIDAVTYKTNDGIEEFICQGTLIERDSVISI